MPSSGDREADGDQQADYPLGHKKLEAQGIPTLESPGGRRKLVRPTEEGMELAEKTAGRLIKIENEIFDSWTGEELEQYIRLTGRYLEQFREKTGRLGV